MYFGHNKLISTITVLIFLIHMSMVSYSSVSASQSALEQRDPAELDKNRPKLVYPVEKDKDTINPENKDASQEVASVHEDAEGPEKLQGEQCQVFGASTDGSKAETFSNQICRFNHRLECTSTDKTQTQGKDGTCQCAKALSDRAIFVKSSSEAQTGCYIPAGLEQASLCGHEVTLPNELLNDGTIVRKTVGNTANLCVPNAECRTGEKYTGLRCQCVKTASQSADGTCTTTLPEVRDSNSKGKISIPSATASAKKLQGVKIAVFLFLLSISVLAL